MKTLHNGSRIGVGLVCLLVVAGNAWSETVWEGPADGNWSDTLNWSAGVPTDATDAYVGDISDSGSMSAVITQGVEAAVNNLTIGWKVNGTLTMNGDRLDVDGNLLLGDYDFDVYDAGNGIVVQNSGTVYVSGDLNVAGDVWCSGTYQLNGGSLNVNNLNLVGYRKYGNLQIADGASLTVRNGFKIERNVILPAGATVNVGSSIYLPYNRTDAHITATHYHC